MATYNYLDKTGLGLVWGKIKTYIGNNFLSKTNTTSYTPTTDYHPATKKYVDDATSGITSDLVGLTDTSITSPTNGQALLYDSTSSKWKNGTIDTNNLFTITVTSTTENEETIYNADKTFAEIVEAHNVGKILICNGTPLYTARISNPISINDQLIFARSDNASASENENVYILDPIVSYETDPRQVIETEAPIVTVIPRILTWSLTGETYQTNLTASQLKTIYEIFGEIKTGNAPHSVISYMSEYTGSTVHSIISFCTYGRMFLLERYNREDGNEWIETNMSSPINEVHITDNNTATVLTSDKGFTDILNSQFSGNSIIAYVNCSTIASGQYQLISTISEHDFDTNTTTGKAVFSNGKEKIYVTDSQYSSTAPSDLAGKYSCSFVHMGIPNDIYSPQDGQILTYDNTNSVWVNSDLPSIPTASSTTPSADGTGAVGTSTAYARADHVHPKITQALSISSNVITLTGSDGTTSSVTLPVYNGGVSS